MCVIVAELLVVTEDMTTVTLVTSLHVGVIIADVDNTGVITDDDEDMPEYASIDVEVTDEMIDEASDKRNSGMDAMAEGGFYIT